MKYLAVVFVSIFLAGVAAVGVSVATSPVAEAAGRGNAAKCGGGKIHLNSLELRSFELHQKARKNHNLRPFCVHPALLKAARSHSKRMIQTDSMTHGNVGKRLRHFGYRWRTYGENIGVNRSPGRMFKAWMKSSGHRRNILNRKFREIGVGTSTGNYGRSRTTMYTVDFGAR